MKISNELLASYAEGNVSKEERNQVRQYLMENPAELESVMMMMDEDYELDPYADDSLLQGENLNIGTLGHVDASTNSCSHKKMAFSDIALSAAAFAPQTIQMPKCASAASSIKRESFNDRLNSLIDELGL